MWSVHCKTLLFLTGILPRRDKPVPSTLQSAIQKLGKPWCERRSLRSHKQELCLSIATDTDTCSRNVPSVSRHKSILTMFVPFERAIAGDLVLSWENSWPLRASISDCSRERV